MMERTFNLEDQKTFARLSGDFNPLHVDPLKVRRFLFGRPVVHGVHLMVWALDQILDKKCRLSHIEAMFNTPVTINSAVMLDVAEEENDRTEIHIKAGGAVAAVISFSTGACMNSVPSIPDERLCVNP